MSTQNYQTPTMKTFVIAAVQPLIVSLKTFYHNTVNWMIRHTQDQDIAITKTQTSLAETKVNVVELAADVTECKRELQSIKGNLYTAEEVAALQKRVRQLDQLVGATFDWIYNHFDEAILKDLPDPDNIVLPEDRVDEDENA